MYIEKNIIIIKIQFQRGKKYQKKWHFHNSIINLSVKLAETIKKDITIFIDKWLLLLHFYNT